MSKCVVYKFKYVDASNLHLFLADFLLKVLVIYIFDHKLYIKKIKKLIFGSLIAISQLRISSTKAKNEIVSESSLVNILSKLLDTQSYNYCIILIICSVAVLYTALYPLLLLSLSNFLQLSNPFPNSDLCAASLNVPLLQLILCIK
jgi:hypothetical protein